MVYSKEQLIRIEHTHMKYIKCMASHSLHLTHLLDLQPIPPSPPPRPTLRPRAVTQMTAAGKTYNLYPFSPLPDSNEGPSYMTEDPIP